MEQHSGTLFGLVTTFVLNIAVTTVNDHFTLPMPCDLPRSTFGGVLCAVFQSELGIACASAVVDFCHVLILSHKSPLLFKKFGNKGTRCRGPSRQFQKPTE